MAKFEKSTRDMVDIDQELEKLEGKKKTKKSSTKEEKKEITPKKKTNNKNKKTTKKKKKHGFFHAVGNFFHETKVEASKIKWPTKKDMIKYSIATIFFIIFFAVFFYLIELILALLKMGV